MLTSPLPYGTKNKVIVYLKFIYCLVKLCKHFLRHFELKFFKKNYWAYKFKMAAESKSWRQKHFISFKISKMTILQKKIFNKKYNFHRTNFFFKFQNVLFFTFFNFYGRKIESWNKKWRPYSRWTSKRLFIVEYQQI
jgi:hypothetical protein